MFSAVPMVDSTDNINQIIGSNSPEACWMYLTKLEKRGNPQTDTNLLLKLKDCYSRVFSRLPLRMYSNSESYAKMLVRYAELKGWVYFRMFLEIKKENCIYSHALSSVLELVWWLYKNVLRSIDDPDDARDNFIVARSNCKGFAFVHIAHAQFEVARGRLPFFYFNFT